MQLTNSAATSKLQSMIHHAYFHSPLGFIELQSDRKGLVSVRFVEAPRHTHVHSPVLRAAIHQLTEYFSGERRQFDLPLQVQGTSFQQSVWRLLCAIPFGETRTYRDIAVSLGNPAANRAVGAAVAANPILIFIPCHRVIASGGKLGGYSGGLWRKAWLLRHEGALFRI